MKQTIAILLTAFALAGTASALSAGYYEVRVERLANDVYKDHNSGAIIQTRFCFILTAGTEEGILHWDSDIGYVKGTLLVGNESCEVKDMH